MTDLDQGNFFSSGRSMPDVLIVCRFDGGVVRVASAFMYFEPSDFSGAKELDLAGVAVATVWKRR